MLILTASQQTIFRDQALDRFIAQLTERVERFWPQEVQCLGAERERSAVVQAVGEAQKLGFRTELDVARFVHLAFAFRSMHFHAQPWALAVMEQADLPPRVRMNRLFDLGIAQLQVASSSPAQG